MKVNKIISGKTCIKILCNKFGFEIKRQKGSHIILIRENGKKVGTVVPNHKEIKRPTLRDILKLAKVDEDEFNKFI